MAIVSSLAFIVYKLAALALFFSSAFFAFFGVWLSELYPVSVRGTGSNFALLIGRLIGGGFGTLIISIIPLPLRLSLAIALITTSVISTIGMSLL
ncbi:hypothetical protein [Sulfolobus sp. E11-6]|uniref:hypothetical protein n=1 Tax=Sulfolobus sp. E11-6 TaxID=2663020 RepID=UPI001EE9E588|nr:hypothetical protein [Sulfolobus sp. E11-6]